MFMVFGKKWPKRKHVYLTKQFYESDISIPWQLVTQPVQESLTLILLLHLLRNNADVTHCEKTVFYFQNKAVYRAKDRTTDIETSNDLISFL